MKTHIAFSLALEFWRNQPSGERTIAKLEALADHYGFTYALGADHIAASKADLVNHVRERFSYLLAPSEPSTSPTPSR